MSVDGFGRDDDERRSMRPKADDGGSPARVVVLTDAQREALLLKARGVSSAPRAPTYLGERIQWAERLHACAWRDRGALKTVPLDGGPLTEGELDELGQRVSFAREAHARYVQRSRQTPAVKADAANVTARLEGLRKDIRGEQKKILVAFDLRFADDARGKAMLARIRRGQGDEDMKTDSVELLGLCEHPAHKAWLVALPRGEAQAAKRLEALHKEFIAAQKSTSTAGDELKELLDLRNRAFALVTAAAQRVLTAGRYVTADDPARRADYRQYRPVAKKPRAKTG